MATVSDNFDRASLGSDWTADSGAWSIDTNYVEQTTTGESYRKLRWAGSALSTNDVAVEAVVQTAGNADGSGVFARGATGATVTYYGLVLFPTSGVYLVEITAGGESILASYTTSPPAANTNVTLRLECSGSTITGYVNGTQRVQTTDATLASGSVGIMSYNGGTANNRADDWTAYDLGGNGATNTPVSVEYVNGAVNSATTATTSCTLTMPANIKTGDVLIAGLVIEVNAPTVTPPGDFTLIASSTPTGTARAFRLLTYWAVVTAANVGTANYTWSVTTGYEWAGFLVAYRNCLRPTVSAASTTNSSSVSHVAPTVTTSRANARVLHVSATPYGTTYTAPSSPQTYTERQDRRSGTGTANVAITVSDALYAAAGATGTATATSANADYWSSQHIVLELDMVVRAMLGWRLAPFVDVWR